MSARSVDAAVAAVASSGMIWSWTLAIVARLGAVAACSRSASIAASSLRRWLASVAAVPL